MSRFVALVLVFVAWAAAAEESMDRPVDVSLSMGVALPGVVQASEDQTFSSGGTASFTTRVSPMARLSATWWPAPRLAWIGPTLSVHYAAIFLPDPVNIGFWDGRDHEIPADGIHFIQVEGGVRGRFFLADTWSVDPAISLGYCRTFSSSPDARDSGMTVNIAADLRWRLPRYQLIATLGLMMQAYGGVEGIAWVRSDPIVYTAIGAGF